MKGGMMVKADKDGSFSLCSYARGTRCVTEMQGVVAYHSPCQAVGNKTKTQGPDSQFALRALARSGMKIGHIDDVTPIPTDSTRRKSGRRGRRPTFFCCLCCILFIPLGLSNHVVLVSLAAEPWEEFNAAQIPSFSPTPLTEPLPVLLEGSVSMCKWFNSFLRHGCPRPCHWKWWFDLELIGQYDGCFCREYYPNIAKNSRRNNREPKEENVILRKRMSS
ncbi:hypothetical protein OROGR_017657 [Orobanche gracilis]